MDRKQFYILIGMIGIGLLNQEILLRRTRMQYEILEAIGVCINSLQEFVNVTYQMDIDEAFEEIVSENFDEGLD